MLASLDVAVLTSDSESLSNVILEAMAARLPVVAYDVGGNSELVNEQRGALVAAGNENEFAMAILRLLSAADVRRQLGENARRFVEENFSLDRVLHRYEDLYVTLLNQKSGWRARSMNAVENAGRAPASESRHCCSEPALRGRTGRAG